MAIFTTHNEMETIALAKEIAEHLKPGMTILLEGDLGAGKTTFAKGIGEGLKINRVIKSPSYTIVREYQEGTIPFYHIDLYRLEASEAEYLGLEEYFEGEGITVVEWPSVAPDELPEERLEIGLRTSIENPNARTIKIEAVGPRYEDMLNKVGKKR